MKRISSRPAPSRVDGFTIVELIVSITVLALVLVFTAQLINGASRVITVSSKRTDADSQSRLVFSRLGQDLARLVKRGDVDFSTFKQPGNPQTGPDARHGANDQFAFYSETVGGYTPAAGVSAGSFSALTARAPLSVVAYQVAAEPNGGATTLRRMAKALGWDPDPKGTWACPVYLPLRLGNLRVNGNPIQLFSDRPTDPTSLVDLDYATVGDMVFRFEYRYLLKPNPTNPNNPRARLSIVPYDTQGVPAHTAVNGLRDVAAVVVTLGVLDSTSRIISGKDQTKLIAVFPDAVDDTTTNQVDTLTAWRAALAKSTFASDAGLPLAAASVVRLYQRTFYVEPN